MEARALEPLGGLLAVLGEEEVAPDQVHGTDGAHHLQDVAHLHALLRLISMYIIQ